MPSFNLRTTNVVQKKKTLMFSNSNIYVEIELLHATGNGGSNQCVDIE